MEDISHHGIEIRNDVGVTVFLDDTNAILEGREGSVQTVALEVGDTLIIIERHIVGRILTGIMTKGYHTVHIVALPGIAQQLQARCSIVRSNSQHLHQDLRDTVRWHLLRIHIRCTEERHILITLWLGKHPVEESQHLRTVSPSLLTG